MSKISYLHMHAGRQRNIQQKGAADAFNVL